METPGDPTPCRPLVAPKSQVKHDQATGRRVRRVNSISFFRGCSELHRDAPQGKVKKKDTKTFDAPDDSTPDHMQQGFRRRRVTRRASSGPGARRWSRFSRAAETEIHRAGPEPPQSRRRWAAAGKFRRAYAWVMGEKRRRRRPLRGAVAGGGPRHQPSPSFGNSRDFFRDDSFLYT